VIDCHTIPVVATCSRTYF